MTIEFEAIVDDSAFLANNPWIRLSPIRTSDIIGIRRNSRVKVILEEQGE